MLVENRRDDTIRGLTEGLSMKMKGVWVRSMTLIILTNPYVYNGTMSVQLLERYSGDVWILVQILIAVLDFPGKLPCDLNTHKEFRQKVYDKGDGPSIRGVIKVLWTIKKCKVLS